MSFSLGNYLRIHQKAADFASSQVLEIKEVQKGAMTHFVSQVQIKGFRLKYSDKDVIFN